MTLSLAFSLFARGLVAWILVTAGGQKAASPASLLRIVRVIGHLRFRPSGAVIRALGLGELVLGIMLLAPVVWLPAALAAGTLLGALSLVLGSWVAGGSQGDCGCGGLLPTKRFDWAHVVTVAALAVLTFSAAVVGIVGEELQQPLPPGVAEEALVLSVPLYFLIATSVLSHLAAARRSLRQHPGASRVAPIAAKR